ncbi:unnamed protein product [Gadus morhua 'NCC']
MARGTKRVEQSDSAAAPPPPLPSKRKHRGTPRFKSRLRQDTRVLEEQKGKPQCQTGDPCPTCAQPRTLDTGHALYKSSVYCESEAGPGGLTAREWLISQQALEDAGKVPRTILWNIARRKEGQGESFCSLCVGKGVDLWLAERRDRKRRKPKRKQRKQREERRVKGPASELGEEHSPGRV